MAVTYRGPVEELQGTDWDVPESVIRSGQGAKWIESQHRQAQAEEAARAEAEQRQRELLAARLEQQRQQAEAEQEALAQEQGQVAADGQFRVELTDLSQSVMAAGAAIVGKAEVVEAKCQEWEGRHEALVANSEQAVAAAAAQVEFSNATTQADHEQINAELEAAQQRISSLESELRTVVMGLTGPQGDRGERGLAGSGVGYVDSDPTRIEQGSLGKRIFGRAVVPGDLLLQRTPDALKVWRTPDGKGWQQVDQIVNAQELVSQRLAVTDRSTQVTASMVTIKAGGGGGGGGERLLTDSVGKGGTVTIADSSNWTTAGHQNPKSGTVFVEVADANTSERGTVHAVIVTGNSAGDTRVTEFALLGSLFEKGVASPDVDIDATPGNAVVPPGLTGVSPLPGANRTLVTIRIGANLGAAGPYILSGMVFWNQRAEGRAIDLNQPSLQPAWIWA